MKRIFISLVALVLTMGVNAQNLKISGSVKGLHDGDVLTFVPVTHDDPEPVATAKIANGQFKTDATINEPYLVYIKVNGNWAGQRFMVSPGDDINVTITGAQKNETERGAHYNLNAKVEGSSLQPTYLEKISIREELNKERMDFRNRYKDLDAKMSKLYQANDQEGIKALKESAEYKAMSADDLAFFKKVESSYCKLFADNSNSFWAPLLMLDVMAYFTPDMKSIYDGFSAEAKQSYFGKKVKEELFPGGGAGEKIPEFTLKDESGKAFTYADLAKGKKYVLLDFWASWCAPCRKEIPNVKKNYEAYKDKGFEVVSISIDQKVDAWHKALKEEQLPWPNFLSNEVANQFKVKAVPTMILVDANGTIIDRDEAVRGENLGKKLASLF